MYSAYIGGLPHAFNIIDDCNGFAGTVAVLVCLIGATFGFLVWNLRNLRAALGSPPNAW